MTEETKRTIDILIEIAKKTAERYKNLSIESDNPFDNARLRGKAEGFIEMKILLEAIL